MKDKFSTIVDSEKQRIILWSVAISIILLVVKFYSYLLTGSNAILTDALESIVNVVASFFALYSVRLSAVPKDKNHPYGHGKIEFFSAGIEGTLIIVAGIFILYQSFRSFLFPQPLIELPLGMVLIGFSGVVNGILGYVLQRKGKELNSLTLEADGKHISTDAISSFVLIFGIGIIFFTGWYTLDSIISLLFALYIIYNGYFLVRKSVAGLMDESNPKSINKAVKILNNHRQKNWIDIHNMRVQQYGGDNHVDLHLTLPYYYDLVQVHDCVHEVEEVLEENLPGKTEVFVHADPCIPDPCCHYCQVENCPVRKFPQSKKIKWTADNMSQNQKHYHELGQFKTNSSKKD
ncbi:cation diffusion facilitator family transporter [Cyclobacterium marinum]|uniref:Cation diffusion facilitator family transporter n=1 Tax=Cyclobacterium marinum (strain ATCC 25205 / DSM 745 / LMG 13164 / NCIMB 1802) TaxID=880070 RepID=G0IWE2_CYCMS|nr:cation diffusion facilitator family transporter [Cyclobacterium marinum]AEL27130.1 cation diffusion facilitator family transporter [Cyclobacterium marinum DSM 745]